MAVSDNSKHRQEQAWNRPLNRLSRYDLVLAVIPILFTASVLVSLFTPVSLHLAMGAGALTSALLVADALYLNPPTNASDGESGPGSSGTS
ncbi:hypothetical protein [Halovenus salina]|uniref:hypothetical protein n=1 Tax=Halovenus salina TaxID=1510225 RepID=UPI0022609F7D|nr:hypothetical protein [Halovenus salina]